MLAMNAFDGEHGWRMAMYAALTRSLASGHRYRVFKRGSAWIVLEVGR